MPAISKSAYTGAMKLGAAGGKDHMANDRLASLADSDRAAYPGGRRTHHGGAQPSASPRIGPDGLPPGRLRALPVRRRPGLEGGAARGRDVPATTRPTRSSCLSTSRSRPGWSRRPRAARASWFAMLLDPAVVGELLADGRPPRRPGPPGAGVGVTPVEPPLLDAVNRLVALLDAPRGHPAARPARAPRDHLPDTRRPAGARLRQFAAAGAPAHRIARAIRWLTDHFAEPLPGRGARAGTWG